MTGEFCTGWGAWGFGACAVCGAPGAFGLGVPKAEPRERRRFLWACDEAHRDAVEARIRAMGLTP